MVSVKSKPAPEQDQRQADTALVRAAEAGGADARRALADRVLDRIRTSVRYLCADHPDAGDFVQLSLVEVLRSARNFRGDSRLETWVDRVTVRTTLRHLKATRAEQALKRPEDPSLPATTEDPERALTRARVQTRMAHMLQKLSPERRGAMVLQIVYGYSVREIADLTDVPLETVRDRLKVGKKKLRRLVLTDDALREWAKDRNP